MPDQNVSPYPPRPLNPSITVTVTELARSYAIASRDPGSGVVTVAVGSATHRIEFADDPGILLALLHEAAAQVQAAGHA